MPLALNYAWTSRSVKLTQPECKCLSNESRLGKYITNESKMEMRWIWKMQHKYTSSILYKYMKNVVLYTRYIVLKKHKKAWHRSTEIRKTYLTELVLEQKFMEQFVRFTLPKLHGCKFIGLVLMASALPCASSFGDIIVYFWRRWWRCFLSYGQLVLCRCFTTTHIIHPSKHIVQH